MGNNHDLTDHSDELDMIKAVLAGEKEMYQRLVEKYPGPGLFGHCAADGSLSRGGRSGPGDLLAGLPFSAFFPGDSRFSTWLLRIAVNKALDYLRSNRREKRRVEGFTRQVELKSEGGPEKELLQKEQQEYLHGILELLAPCYRHALKRRYLDGYSYREIAREAGGGAEDRRIAPLPGQEAAADAFGIGRNGDRSSIKKVGILPTFFGSNVLNSKLRCFLNL